MSNKNTIIFAITLVLVGIVIAGGILVDHRKSYVADTSGAEVVKYVINPVTDDDHILGSPNADVILVEYSDFRCSYCREFHLTMKQLINEYGKTGNFAWVYRHFPREDALQNTNSLSITAAIASECVSDLGGEKKFWDYISKINEDLQITYDKADLENAAIELEIDKEEYIECLISGKFNEKIQKSIDDGLMIYNNDSSFGTPYSIILTNTGKQIEIVGAQDYHYIKEIIKQYTALKDTI